MSFSTEMLDGWSSVYKRGKEVLSSTSEVAYFFKSWASTLEHYGKDLQKLSNMAEKKGEVTMRKFKSCDREIGTVASIWITIHQQLYETGKNYMSFATHLKDVVSKELDNFVKVNEKRRKTLESSGQKLTRAQQEMNKKLQTAKGVYDKACKDADHTQNLYLTAQADPEGKKSHIAKLKSKATKAISAAGKADDAYKKTLAEANAFQSKYYTADMPNLLTEFQKFDEERTSFIQKMYNTYLEWELKIPELTKNFTSTIEASVKAIDKAKDVTEYISLNKTGVVVPPEIEYLPYDVEHPAFEKSRNERMGASGPITGKVTSATPSKAAAGAPAGADGLTYFNPDKKAGPSRVWGLTAADDGLDVAAKRAKLDGQLNDLKALIHNEVKSRKGLEKLVQYYKKDPAGKAQAESELEAQKNKIEELKRHKADILATIDGLSGGSAPAAYAPPSLATPVVNEPPAPVAAPAPTGLQVEGLYDYAATNDTELSFSAGDILNITEKDDSGWWYAELNGKEGFIPSNYVKDA